MNKQESKYYNTALLMDEALLLLLEKKEYEFITVKEICEKAGVNRSTFYLHYESIDDLLYETIEMINRRISEKFNNAKINISSLTKDSLFLIEDKYLIPYLECIKENKKIYKIIHNNPFLFKNQEVFKKMYDTFFKTILDKYEVPIDEQEYIFSFYSFGLVAIVQKWIDNDCEDDIDKIREIMKKVIKSKNEIQENL